MEYINEAPGAPKAVGPYSPAVVAGQYVFLSGQIPLDPETGELVGGEIEAQTDRVLLNAKAVLAGLGLGFEHVAKTTIFLTDLVHFQRMNAVYEKHLGGLKPARSTIQVAALPKGASVEIEMVAFRG